MHKKTSKLNAADPLRRDLLGLLIDEHEGTRLPRFDRLWSYYRNPLDGVDPGQRQGLPPRLQAKRNATEATAQGHCGARSQREVVIENDIAWRVHTLVDFMFGRSFSLQSLAATSERAEAIEDFLRMVFDDAGGPGFFQDLGLLGSVHGHVDVLVRPGERRVRPRLEIIEAPRAVPLLSPADYRRLDAYAIHCREQTHELERDTLLAKVRDRVMGRGERTRRRIVEHTEVWTAGRFANYRDGDLTASGVNHLGRLPIVHIQNLPQPYHYEGLSEVEPLIPLQDELNTRLSDRANRVTFQSFKMYLGKGIDGFIDRPVGPGQMWATDNLDATIQEFGGDGNSPSETIHITEIREAMDKASGVSPVATGVVRDKVGNLSSENALRIVMMGLLARTEKKRVTYGAGIAQLCDLILHAADLSGAFPNTPDERRVRLDWPDPMPDSESQRLRHAQTKLEIGVPRRQVLAELGYADGETPNA